MNADNIGQERGEPRLRIDFEAEPASDAIGAVAALIASAAETQRPGAGYREIAFLLRDVDGAIRGGLAGIVLYDWVFVKFLAVDAPLRGAGWGARLLESAERWARDEGLGGLWLETFSFQAPDFYRRAGFTEFGRIEDHPAGASRIFFQKRFEPS